MTDESLAKLAKMLRFGNFRLGHETLLQEDVEALFERNSVGFRREFILGPGERVDFLVGDRIAVELKVKCSPRVMMRQLQRYAAHDKVQAIILVTATVTSMPDSMNGKPVYVVNLGRSEEGRVGKECVSRGRSRGAP